MNEIENRENLFYTGRVKGMNVLIHVGVWFVIFLLPNISTGNWSPKVYIRAFSVMIPSMIVFYTNYFWLIERYLFVRKVKPFLLSNLLLLGLVLLFMYLLSFLPIDYADLPKVKVEPKWNIFLVFQFVNFVLYAMFVALSVAIKMTLSWFRVERIQQMFEKERAEAELKNLKSQLNPHFLFNTLNNIYTLISFSPEKAQDAVHELSGLLRYVLYESCQPQVLLQKDVDFIQDYVDLMYIRLPKHVKVKTNFKVNSPETLIAPLLFISLVENAFKHGVSTNKASFIHLDIIQKNNQVVCSIINTYYPKNPNQDKSGSGIGLANLRKRLELIYPNKYTFDCGRDGDNYRSYLAITLN